MQYFQLSIGPVKEFIVTARRTKDLHAGSYILSMLATVGIRSTMDQGGKILLPDADKSNTDWILKDGGEPPIFPKFPNRFFAEVSDGFDPKKVVKNIKLTFKVLADEVWGIALDDIDYNGNGFSKYTTKTIWDRQVNNYLHIQWVITKNNEPASLDQRKNASKNNEPASLDQRKNASNYFPENEEGFKCMTMVGLQELSGNQDLSAEKRNKFWKIVNKKHKEKEPKGIFDIKNNKLQIEHLSAIAYIKRCFYAAFERGIVIDSVKIGGKSLHFKTPDYMQEIPSTDKMAKRADPQSTFYAILAMDGDKFGEFFYNEKSRNAIKDTLNKYILKVEEIVNNNQGLLIYCGGEDILAMLPLNKALNTAKELRSEFIKCFKNAEKIIRSQDSTATLTISAAIVYTQYKMPLIQSVNRAQELLDNIAKDKTGRNALALEINKPSGRLATWSLPWDSTKSEDSSIPTVLNDNQEIVLQSIIDDLKDNDNKSKETEGKKEGTEVSFSNKFLYRFRNTYRNFDNKLADDKLIKALIFADYYHSVGNIFAEEKEEKKKKKGKIVVENLIEQSKVVEKQKVTGEISDAAAMIARFIATDGVIPEKRD